MRFLSRVLFVAVLICLGVSQSAVAETITHRDHDYEVNAELYKSYAELHQMILNTESMDEAERQYWFNLMPAMKPAQIDRLYEILDTERRKLAELEIKYQKEIKNLNRKHYIEWMTLRLKESFKEDPERVAKLFLPVLDDDAIPPVALRRFKSMEDIPRRPLSALIPGNKSETLVSAFVTPDLFEGLFENDTTPEAVRMVFVSYALEMASNRDDYETTLDKKMYADFIKFGAKQAATLNRVADLEVMASKVPDIVDRQAYETPEEAVKRLVVSFEKGMAGEGKRPLTAILSTLEKLTGYLSAEACDDRCQDMIDTGIVKVLSEQDALITEMVVSLGGAPTIYEFYIAVQLDYLSLFASDGQKRTALQALSDKIDPLVQSYAKANTSPAFVNWASNDDTEKLGNFVLASIDTDGQWPEDSVRWGWYSDVIGRYHNRALQHFANALQAVQRVELQAGNGSGGRLLEGPLIEAKALAILDLLVSGDCTDRIVALEALQASAGDLGKTPDSSAYGYREVTMVKAMSSPRLIRRFCTGLVKDTPQQSSDWHAILIGVSDTTVGAPSYGLSPSDDYYLGDIPHNDVKLMRAALRASHIPWQVTSLTGKDVTRQVVAETVSRVFAQADSNDHIVVYFTGHGRLGKNGDTSSYMRFLDGAETDVASWAFAAARSNASHSALIFDMCLVKPDDTTEYASKGTSRTTGAYAADVAARNSGLKTSVNMIFATEEGMPAIANRDSGQSAFTALLAPVLAGDFHVGPDRDISMQEALDYVREGLRKDPRYRQFPQSETVRGRLDWVVSGYRH